MRFTRNAWCTVYSFGKDLSFSIIAWITVCSFGKDLSFSFIAWSTVCSFGKDLSFSFKVSMCRPSWKRDVEVPGLGMPRHENFFFAIRVTRNIGHVVPSSILD